MKILKSFFTLFFVLLFAAIWYVVILVFIMNNKDEKPLIDAKIPQETIDFFTGLVDFVDIGVIYNPFPDIRDWGKYESIKDMKTIEDTCFIVFYSAQDSIRERPKADLALRYSNEAIPELKDFMKNYPYPYQVRGRKLPIYLANSTGQYSSIIRQLGISGGGSGSIGMYIYQISFMGTLAKGIVISPEAWENKGALSTNEDEEFKKTLWHEINHYVYFTYFDYFKNAEPYLWFTEGCAEFFSGNSNRLKQVNKTRAQNFRFNSNTTNSDVYWVGYTAYVYYKKTYGRNLLSNLVYYSYTNNLNKALANTSGISLTEWESGWKNYIRNISENLANN